MEIFVVALNRRQFENYMYEKAQSAKAVEVNRSEGTYKLDGVLYRFCSSPRILRGRSYYGVEFCGTFWDRDDFEELREEIAFRFIAEGKPIPWK